MSAQDEQNARTDHIGQPETRAKHKNNEIEDLKKAVWYSLRAYELACAKAEGRQPINIDNKQDDGNPFGSGFLRDLGVYQDGERAILNDRR